MSARLAFLHAVALYAPLVAQHVQIQQELEPRPDTSPMVYTRPVMPKTAYGCVVDARAWLEGVTAFLPEGTGDKVDTMIEQQAVIFVEDYFGYQKPKREFIGADHDL